MVAYCVAHSTINSSCWNIGKIRACSDIVAWWFWFHQPFLTSSSLLVIEGHLENSSSCPLTLSHRFAKFLSFITLSTYPATECFDGLKNLSLHIFHNQQQHQLSDPFVDVNKVNYNVTSDLAFHHSGYLTSRQVLSQHFLLKRSPSYDKYLHSYGMSRWKPVCLPLAILWYSENRGCRTLSTFIVFIESFEINNRTMLKMFSNIFIYQTKQNPLTEWNWVW